MSDDNLWTYRDETWSQDTDMVGYDVQATDGSIGKIDEASHEEDSSYLVVDTGFWIFGKKRLVPAGTVERVDHAEKKVWLGLTKDQVKDAPDYEQETWDDTARGTHTEFYKPYNTGV